MTKAGGWFLFVLIGILSINGVVFSEGPESRYLLQNAQNTQSSSNVKLVSGYPTSDNGIGIVITDPVFIDKNVLIINADVKKGGSIQVEIVSEDDSSVGKSNPITSDVINGQVIWSDVNFTELVGADKRFRFKLTNATLYSFAFVNSDPEQTAKLWTDDPIHFRPKLPTKKTVGDVMPFYWKGEYHIFYLDNPMGNYDVSWEHCSSKDLVNWKEYPTALKPDLNDVTGPEGCCMFTGCVVEKDGIFYAWYTNWNPKNPDGREFISLATSKDLITWTKHPEHMIGPDGVHFQKHQEADFRDPQIFWNDEKQEYWMHLLVNEVGVQGEAFGLLTSKDLIHWEQKGVVKLANGTADECPDYFRIGDTHYIHAISRYFYADNIEGPYRLPEVRHDIDRPAITAPKRVWDGKRHVWFGSTWEGHV
ncbi:MAG: family 43 glycosylhydrolase, partial [Planctomycetota bacterium]